MTEIGTVQESNSRKSWGPVEKASWLAEQKIRRSYYDEVVVKLNALDSGFTVEQYGALSIDPDRYPLFLVKNKYWQPNNKIVLITGGVHGYETSGVQGAIRFLEITAGDYLDYFNFVVLPCISPWGYETINRWNSLALDPNRSFFDGSPCEESALAMKAVTDHVPSLNVLAHLDLHETTDTDNTVFRPALAARDGVEQDNWSIPDGFYTVGDTNNPANAFQKAIIDSVSKVTFIAPPDENGFIIGEKMTQPGVINYATKSLFLCSGFTNCSYASTTEVYPDSPRVTTEECTLAQVAAVKGALDYLISLGNKKNR